MGAVKDQNSVLLVSLLSQTKHRIHRLETAIIKATSHDESQMDYKNAERVFTWIGTYPISLKPLLCSLTTRMERTRSWVVALKGLILMHGVFCCKTPTVKRIGQLPFDFSMFEDGHHRSATMWGFNVFIRAYFTFLDHYGELCMQSKHVGNCVLDISMIKDWQDLLDQLMLVKPMADNMKHVLIMEAMDCLIIEIFNLNDIISNYLAQLIACLDESKFRCNFQKKIVVKVILKAKKQAKEIDEYFRFCQSFGVVNAKELPKHLHCIQDLKLDELHQILNRSSTRKEDDFVDKKALVVRNEADEKFRTTVTDDWEVFHDDFDSRKSVKEVDYSGSLNSGNFVRSHPFQNFMINCKRDIPDLISF